jgi:hypothetical protein
MNINVSEERRHLDSTTVQLSVFPARVCYGLGVAALPYVFCLMIQRPRSTT